MPATIASPTKLSLHVNVSSLAPPLSPCPVPPSIAEWVHECNDGSADGGGRVVSAPHPPPPAPEQRDVGDREGRARAALPREEAAQEVCKDHPLRITQGACGEQAPDQGEEEGIVLSGGIKLVR